LTSKPGSGTITTFRIIEIVFQDMRRPRLEENREFYAAVGQRIAKLRTGRLTQEALANRTGLTRTSIINIEKGRQQILLHTMMDISRALQVPVSDLIPEMNNLDMMLRDKPQTGLDWIKSAASKSRR
jgi:DNA-binding XRE family transcriptional regulator